MLKTVKNGSGILVDRPPPCFFKIPTFSGFFLETSQGAFLMVHALQCKRNFCPQSKQNYFRRTIPLSDQNIETGIKVYVHKILDLAI